MLNKIRSINEFIKYGLPEEEYAIVNSAWLSMMGIRINGDLDIIITDKLWDSTFSNKNKLSSFGLPGEYENRIRIHSQNGPYSQLKGIRDNNQLINEKYVLIKDIKFIMPRYYFEYKFSRLKKMSENIILMPWFKRIGLFRNYNESKWCKKYNKDYKDFIKVKEYFLNKNHKYSELSFVSDEDWGLDKERRLRNMNDDYDQ